MTAAAALITVGFSLSAQDKLVPGKGDVEVFYANGEQFGVWHPDTRVFELTYMRKTGDYAGQHVTFTFKDDGNVYFDIGTVAGTMSASGSMSATSSSALKNIQVSTRYILYKLTEIGQINDRCDVYIYGQKAYYCSAPMDKNALCFAAVCASLSDKDLTNYKNARNKKSQEAAAKAPKPTVGQSAAKIEVSINDNGYIDFRGFMNYLTYSRNETMDTIQFNDEKRLPVVRVEHNNGSRNYEVKIESNGKLIGTFPDSIDPRFGAVFVYGFFDK